MPDQTPPPEEKKQRGGKKTRRKNQPDDNFDWRRLTRNATFWILLIVVVWIVVNQLNMAEKPEFAKSYSQYRSLLESGQIDGATIIDREFHGKLKDGTSILVILPFIDQQMLVTWDSLKVDYEFKDKTTSWLGQFFISILPWLLFIGIWIWLIRRMQGGGAKGIFSFGKSRAKLSLEGKPKLTFEDVAGCDEAKEELAEVIEFLRDPKRFSKLGGRIPKGALLLGPPGTGKTLLARAVAGEAEVPFFSMSGADFVEMFVGVGAARVRDLFETGKKHAPCIIFIDEIDAVGRHRGAGLGGGHDEREQTLNQLLVEMDGFESNEGVILIAATNRPDVLDPALTRPGRFDRQIVVDRPDVRGREGILKVHTRKIPLADDVRLEILAKGTPGLAGAELANLVNEAALLAARKNESKVAMNHFDEAKDKVMMGAERKSMLISEEEKKQTAYHEAGHVLVAKLTPGSDPVHKVTIIPRGRALGLTHYLPLDEKHNYSRTYLKQTLIHLLGGRAAEKIVFNELSTGAGNDIERATEIARRMVCEWGMSDRMGPIAFGRKQEEIFLGREIATHRDFSERTAQEIDTEVRRIVSDAEKTAEKLLRENSQKLKILAEALLEREILDGEEIDYLLTKGRLPLPQPKPVIKEAELPRLPQPPQSKPRIVRTVRHLRRQPQQARTPVSQKSQPPESKAAAASTPSDTKPAAAQQSSPVKSGEESSGKSPSQLRREFARSYGVVSSRDPGNRRPTSSEMARQTRQRSNQDKAVEAKSPETPPAAVEEPKEASVEPTSEKRSSRYRRTRRTYSSSRRNAKKSKSAASPDSDKPNNPKASEPMSIQFQPRDDEPPYVD